MESSAGRRLLGFVLVLPFVTTLGGCAGVIGSIVSNTINSAPVAVAQIELTTYDDEALAITLGGSDVEGDSLEFTVVTEPSYGTLSGTAPNLTYTPDLFREYSDSLTFKVSDGSLESDTSTVTINVQFDGTVKYLRADGNDSNDGGSAAPFLTAQAAVDDINALSPSSNSRYLINVGPGSFGDIILNEDFGEYVGWQNSESGVATIGNISANGLSAFENGYDIFIRSNSKVTFGNIESLGATELSSPGSGGNISIVGNTTVGNISSIGGNATAANSGPGGNGGIITIGAGVTSGNIAANGGKLGEYGTSGGIGGTITINGNSQTVSANGGDVSIYTQSSNAGNGGVIIINGSATVISALGGANLGNNTRNAGNGGDVTINGTVTSINATGGYANVTNSTGLAGVGGNVIINGVVTASTLANGGSKLANNIGQIGGLGGSIVANFGANTGALIAEGGYATGSSFTSGGVGGSISYSSGATILSMSVAGGTSENLSPSSAGFTGASGSLIPLD